MSGMSGSRSWEVGDWGAVELRSWEVRDLGGLGVGELGVWELWS